MIQFWHTLLQSLVESGTLYRQMAVYLLLGFAANALVALFVPEKWILRHLGQRGFKGVLWATLLGIPLPLCSCSVLPMAMGLRARGASIGATVAFLIATPQTGVDSILVTGQVIGWPFAIFKVVAALLTGLTAGVIAEWWLGEKTAKVPVPAPPAAVDQANANAHDHGVVGDHGDHHHRDPLAAQASTTWATRFRQAALVGLWDFPASLGGVLVLGILIGGVISALLPPDALAIHSTEGRLASMATMLLMAVPMYVCSTGSVPIAAGFHHAGVPQGALLIFLMAGPATNIAEISVIKKQLGWRALTVFLGVIIVASLGLGMAFEDFQGLVQFNSGVAMPPGHEHHAMAAAAATSATATATMAAPPTLFEWISMAVLAALLLAPPLTKIARQLRALFGNPTEEPAMTENKEGVQTYEFELTGLNCDHCIRSTKNSLEGMPGLESLTVSLRKAVLRGKHLDAAEVERRIKAQGFEAHLATPPTHA